MDTCKQTSSLRGLKLILFKLIYKDVVASLSIIPERVSVGGKRFSVICYGGDILLPSITITGLQTLIETAHLYDSRKSLTHSLHYLGGTPSLTQQNGH